MSSLNSQLNWLALILTFLILTAGSKSEENIPGVLQVPITRQVVSQGLQDSSNLSKRQTATTAVNLKLVSLPFVA